MFKKEEVGSSPLPAASPEIIEGKIEESGEEILMDFYLALREIADGKKVTKKEWNNEEEYGFMNDEKLCIRLKGEDHHWIISLGDMAGEDYIVLK